MKNDKKKVCLLIERLSTVYMSVSCVSEMAAVILKWEGIYIFEAIRIWYLKNNEIRRIRTSFVRMV